MDEGGKAGVALDLYSSFRDLFYHELLFVVLFVIFLLLGRRVWLIILHVILLCEGLAVLIVHPKDTLILSDGNVDDIHVYLARSVGWAYVTQVITFCLLSWKGDYDALTTCLWTYFLNMAVGVLPVASLFWAEADDFHPKPREVRAILLGRVLAGIGCLYFALRAESPIPKIAASSTSLSIHLKIDSVASIATALATLIHPPSSVNLLNSLGGWELKVNFLHSYMASIVACSCLSTGLMSWIVTSSSNRVVGRMVLCSHIVTYVATLSLNELIMVTDPTQVSWGQRAARSITDILLVVNCVLGIARDRSAQAGKDKSA